MINGHVLMDNALIHHESVMVPMPLVVLPILQIVPMGQMKHYLYVVL
jgi:hypothetical protein